MSDNFSIDIKDFKISNKSKVTEVAKSADYEKYIVQLRDCFNAGYQFPQYCIDNNIKKPLFVGVDERQKDFLWEIYAQFHFDRRIFQAGFCLLNGDGQAMNYSLTFKSMPTLKLKKISEVNFDIFDKIFILTEDKTFAHKKAVYLDQIFRFFFKQTYNTIPLLHFMQKNPQVKLVIMLTPSLRENEYNTDYEKFVIKEKFNVETVRKKIKEAQAKGETISTPYDFLGYTNDEVLRLLTVERKTNPDGTTSLKDDAFRGIVNGIRMTANQPKTYKNTIYFVGNCVYYGHGVPYDKTVESYLQKLLNEHNLPYRVENESQQTQFRRQDLFYTLDKIDFKPYDIVFVSALVFKGTPYCDVTHILDRPHDYGEVFPDAVHINENGHRAWADKIFEYLTENDFFRHTNFEYPPPPLYPTVMVFQKKMLQAQQNFWTTKTWTFTKQSCVTNDLKSAA